MIHFCTINGYLLKNDDKEYYIAYLHRHYNYDDAKVNSYLERNKSWMETKKVYSAEDYKRFISELSIKKDDIVVFIATKKDGQDVWFDTFLECTGLTDSILYKDAIGATNHNYPDQPNNLVTYVLKAPYDL